MHSIRQKKTNETLSLINRSNICLLFILTTVFSLGVNATTFPVSNTNDAGAGSLRQAIIDANANPGADIIDATGVTGTISLLSLLPNITQSVTITGPGMTLLTINQTIDRRVFTTGSGAVIFVLQDLTLNFSGPGAVPYSGGGGAILAGGAGAATTLTNVTISNFRFQIGNGGAISQSSSLNTHSLTITNCIFTNNKCGAAGGAVSYNGLGTATITGCTFSGDTATTQGGAINITGGGSGPVSTNILRNTFLNNVANGNTFGGAAVAVFNAGTININFNRIVGNTAAGVASGKNITTGGGVVSTMNSDNNWWGVNTGPSAADIFGTAAAKWLQLKTTASPNPICTTSDGPGNTSTVTTGFLSNSANEAIAVSDLSPLIGLPVTWGPTTLGSLSGEQLTIQATGTATATFTSNGTGGTASVNAQVDNVPASEASPSRASITVNTSSIAPTGATGATTICNGSSTTLTVDGGTKGTGATTEWFTGSCGGTPEGTGDAIMVSPTTTTTYYVRYTGPCNTTTCATVTVTINTLSTAPTGATGTTTICSGSSTTLTVDGGSKGTGASTEWFTWSCGGTPAGTGDAINVSPGSTTTYYVRYSGTCNTTTCASVTVTVNQLPTISAPTVVQPTCATPTGTITINATGSGTLEYSIDGGSNWFTTNVFSGLAPGSYNISVRSQSAPSCVSVYSGNPVVLTAATNCCTSTCSNSNPTLYFGYPGDQSSTVKVIASGGTAPYTVSITMNRPLNCNVITSSGDELWVAASGTSTNNVCPASGTNPLPPVSTGTIAASGGFYSVDVTLMADATFTATVTDATGCVTSCTTFIHAEDVRCFAGNSGNNKVAICHHTGNPANPCTSMCVPESSLASHLAHGDFVGNCTPNCVAPAQTRTATVETVPEEKAPVEKTSIEKVSGKKVPVKNAPVLPVIFRVRVVPNPSDNYFTLNVETGSNEKIVVIVYDVLGRKVKHIENSDRQFIRFGEDLKAGSYMAIVRQGENTKTIKLVKQ